MALLSSEHVAKRSSVPKFDATLQATLGIVVRTCRQNLGITQEELAWRANLHRTYIADIERGARNISLRSIANLAEALQISVGSLFASAHGGLGLTGEEGNDRKLDEVLLIEDEVADAELALRALQRAAFSNPVKVVRDGQEALDYLLGPEKGERRRPRALPMLILLDLGLPKISGLDVLRRIKGDERTRSIPVIVLSGSRQNRNITESARLGAANYIIKPVRFDDVSRISAKLNLRWSITVPPASISPRNSS